MEGRAKIFQHDLIFAAIIRK